VPALAADANVEITSVHATSNGEQAYFRLDLAPSACGVFFAGGRTECLKGRIIRQDAGDDGSFESPSWSCRAPGRR
jgi:hypothetical protein